ncbi:hypothetical protein F2P81_003905 [Scophthalmus maximus]|uniref:Ragulator complex protein LAMTOR3 n=1 Tax=Scophthalmus maximus TaxID=52904 RepID=A0A6A4TDU8_SCOMX|nr:hypothetical protein F2P81_003905 [Scophthalmus maximus]
MSCDSGSYDVSSSEYVAVVGEDLKRYLYKQLQSVDGLHAIVVTDRDGVPVIKVANDNAPVHALRPAFLSTFALATDQGSKLGLSKNKSIICYYNTYQIVQFNRLPLVISFIASSSANTGKHTQLQLTWCCIQRRSVVKVARMERHGGVDFPAVGTAILWRIFLKSSQVKPLTKTHEKRSISVRKINTS